MRIFSLMAFAFVWLFSSSAHAQWVHTMGEDDPFAGGAQHMGGTQTQSGEMILFRCTSRDDLALLFVSIEKPDPKHVQLMAITPAKLLVIIDGDPVQSFDAKVDTTPNGERYRFTATDPALAVLVETTRKAKKRFAIAVEALGQRLYSTAVNVRFSKTALGALAEGCKL